MIPIDSSAIRLENIAPILRVRDMQRSLAFYVEVLGFGNAEWGNDQFTLIRRDNTGIYLSQGAQGMPGTWIWIGFEGNIFQWHEYLKISGAVIKLPPTNFSWAYELQVEDPDGHVLRFGTDPNMREPFADR